MKEEGIEMPKAEEKKTAFKEDTTSAADQADGYANSAAGEEKPETQSDESPSDDNDES